MNRSLSNDGQYVKAAQRCSHDSEPFFTLLQASAVCFILLLLLLAKQGLKSVTTAEMANSNCISRKTSGCKAGSQRLLLLLDQFGMASGT